MIEHMEEQIAFQKKHKRPFIDAFSEGMLYVEDHVCDRYVNLQRFKGMRYEQTRHGEKKIIESEYVCSLTYKHTARVNMAIDSTKIPHLIKWLGECEWLGADNGARDDLKFTFRWPTEKEMMALCASGI